MNRPDHSSPNRGATQIESGGAESPGSPGDNPVDAEAWVLRTAAGNELLARISQVGLIGPADLARFRKTVSPARVSAAARLYQGRARAALKFEHGAKLWVEATAIEQATSELVARHKAARFAGCPLVVDLCAGIGGDSLALAAGSNVLAVDLDQGMCRRLLYNACVYGVADRVLPVLRPRREFCLTARCVAASRSGSAGQGDHCVRVCSTTTLPGPDFWKRAITRVDAGAIKLGPASDFARHFTAFEHEVEIEIISLQGECKEATVWFGALARCRRRATRLPENVTWTDREGPTGRWAEVQPLGDLIFDPDPALLRAGLLDGFALEHGLARVADGVDYLTGPLVSSTPFLTAFHVVDVLPFDLKRLKKRIADHDIGTLEIKVRGVDVDPETLRRGLRLTGSRSGSVLVFGGGNGPVRAVLAQRLIPPG